MEAKSTALTEATAGLAQKMYEEQQAQAGAEGAGPDMGDAEQPEASAAGDDVVDAEFEEVDDKK